MIKFEIYLQREGKSKFNKIYEFNYNVWNRNCKMIMTSVSGHLLTNEFYQSHRSWQSCQPYALFDAPVKKGCSEDFRSIKETLEREEIREGRVWFIHFIVRRDCIGDNKSLFYNLKKKRTKKDNEHKNKTKQKAFRNDGTDAPVSESCVVNCYCYIRLKSTNIILFFPFTLTVSLQ